MRVAYRIAVVSGDGIGTAGIPAALAVRGTPGDRFFRLDHFDWSCERYLRTGRMTPQDGPDTFSGHDAILPGAVGRPATPA
ncbi:hypothetical protein [Nonomuraea sp. NPDC050643]|uniref:hypothetical protein n=1 Tax=Nonomuraea sp. NPDC050643 TaxID=3155660 RepID=UPI0033F9AA29